MKILSVYIVSLFIASILGCSSQKNNKTANKDIKADTTIVQQLQNENTKISTNENSSTNSALQNNTVSVTVNDFTVIYATSQQWHGGVKGSGGGVNYEVGIITQLPSAQLSIDELWIGEIFHETSASLKFPKTAADGFTKGDTIYLHASDYHKDPEGTQKIEINDGDKSEVKDSTLKNISPPYKYSGDALIGYSVDGVRKYMGISKITAKSPLFYP